MRLYAFLSQIITFTDADLEKLYVFGRLLLRKLPVKRDELPVEIQQNIDMDSYRIKQTASGKIKLDRGIGELEPQKGGNDVPDRPRRDRALSQIIQELNERFGTDFTDDDKVFIQHLEGSWRPTRPGSQRQGEHAGERSADLRPCRQRQDSGIDRHELQVLQADQRRPGVREVPVGLAVREVQQARERGGVMRSDENPSAILRSLAVILTND